MKLRLLSLLSLLVSLQALALVEETVEFDFSDPYSLDFSPAIPTLQDTDGNLLKLTNYTLHGGPVSVNFGVGQGNLGPSIYRSGSFFTLNIRKWSTLTFTVSSDCQLTSIQFGSSNALTCSSDQPGRYDPTRNRWYSFNSTDVTSVTLEQGPSEDSWCPKIVVTYLRQPAALTLVSTTPSEGATLKSFKSMELRFNTVVGSVDPNAEMTLSGTGIEGTRSLLPTVDGNTVRLTYPETIAVDGDYKVNIAGNTFASYEGGLYASPIEVQFKVYAERATFSPIAVSPSPGTYGALPQLITLKFDNYVKIGTGVAKFTHNDGTKSFPAVVTASQDTVTITHEYGRLTDAGAWTVEIPEKLIHNPFIGDDADDRWNPAFVLNYTVDPSAPLSDDSEAMKEAKELLQLTGIGYPNPNSDSYQALEELVNAEETPSDEELEEAILALYNETDLIMPEIDKWYRIAGINSNGDKIYLTFNDEATKVILGQNANNAAAFKVQSVTTDTIVFVTRDGRFLHIPTVLPLHTGTSDTNLTDTLTDVNYLKFAKLLANSIEGVSPKAVFGLFTIYGSLGTFNDKEEFAYALLDFSARKIATYPEWPLEFSTTMSSAFVLEETTEPVDADTIIPTVSLRPGSIDQPGDELLLVITGPRKTTIANDKLISFKNNGQKVDFYDSILTPMPTENQFAVNTEGLEKGTYTIDMPLGTFSFEAVKGKKVQDTALSVEFEIRSNGGGVSGDITPTATLSTTELIASGERLLLTISNVARATLNPEVAPYFVHADGANVGQRVDKNSILTTVTGTTNQFNVNTSGLNGGKYTLVLPRKSFTYEAEEAGKTVNDVAMTVEFTILGFQPKFDAFMVFMPALYNTNKTYLRDTDLNDMYLYIYDYMRSGLEPNPEIKVWVVYSMFSTPVVSGHFEKDSTLVKNYGSEFENTYSLKFVPDRPITEGELDNFSGMYGYYCEAGAFGDANYGKWLAGDKSIAPEDCVINPSCSLISLEVNNAKASNISINSIENEIGNSVYDLQGRKIHALDNLPSGIYIINGKKHLVK